MLQFQKIDVFTCLLSSISQVSIRELAVLAKLKVYGPITYGFIHRSGVFDIR